MHSLSLFHDRVIALLRSGGFANLQAGPDQDVISIRPGDGYELHCISNRDSAWVLLAEFDDLHDRLRDARFAAACLAYNQPSSEPNPTILSTLANGHLALWREMPVESTSSAQSLNGFETFLDEVTQIMQGNLRGAPPSIATGMQSLQSRASSLWKNNQSIAANATKRVMS